MVCELFLDIFDILIKRLYLTLTNLFEHKLHKICLMSFNQILLMKPQIVFM